MSLAEQPRMDDVIINKVGTFAEPTEPLPELLALLQDGQSS